MSVGTNHWELREFSLHNLFIIHKLLKTRELGHLIKSGTSVFSSFHIMLSINNFNGCSKMV